MWTNKQHIMSRLARNNQVVHVDFGLRPLVQYLWKRLKTSPADLKDPLALLTSGGYEYRDNLYLADSYGPIIVELLSRNNRVRDFFKYDFKVDMVRRFVQKRAELDEEPILWVYHPGYADAVDRIPHQLLVYDCVDNYLAFPKYRDDADWVRRRERKLCEKADVVFTTSQELYDLKSGYNPGNTYLVHNVGDAEHFKKALDDEVTPPEKLRRLEGPVLGFVGAVSDYKLDKEWLLAAARKHPEWNLVLIGPVGRADPDTQIATLEELPNVHLLGHRPYDELPRYHKGFDVGVIPYRINDYTRSVFPIKFFEFLATGNPVVISALPALQKYLSAVRVANTAADFVQECENALEHDTEDDRRERVELAENNSWSHRIQRMFSHIGERL